MTKIIVCKHNLEQGTEKVISRIKEKYENVSISVEPCIDACSNCAEGPFAIIGGEIVSAKSTDELYDGIINKL